MAYGVWQMFPAVTSGYHPRILPEVAIMTPASNAEIRLLHDWGVATDRVVTLHVADHEARYHRTNPRRATLLWLASCLVAAMGCAGAAIDDVVRVVP